MIDFKNPTNNLLLWRSC